MKIPKTHPRYESLRQRHMLTEGFEKGFVAQAGLIAHGRGEAFDYLIGEKTVETALEAEKAAVALMLSSERPVLSVNGNTAALVPKDIVRLAGLLSARVEVNLFYRTPGRERLIRDVLVKSGAKEVYGIGRNANKRIPGLESKRGRVDAKGIWAADTVLVPLEDGDRVEALVAINKKVISIDLNPLSRTSQKASVSIVDNVVRAFPNMIRLAKEMRKMGDNDLASVYGRFDNKRNLADMTKAVRRGV